MQARGIVSMLTVEFLQPKSLLEWAAPEAISNEVDSGLISWGNISILEMFLGIIVLDTISKNGSKVNFPGYF